MILVDVANGKPRHVPYRDSKLTFLLQVVISRYEEAQLFFHSHCCVILSPWSIHWWRLMDVFLAGFSWRQFKDNDDCYCEPLQLVCSFPETNCLHPVSCCSLGFSSAFCLACNRHNIASGIITSLLWQQCAWDTKYTEICSKGQAHSQYCELLICWIYCWSESRSIINLWMEYGSFSYQRKNNVHSFWFLLFLTLVWICGHRLLSMKMLLVMLKLCEHRFNKWRSVSLSWNNSAVYICMSHMCIESCGQRSRV